LISAAARLIKMFVSVLTVLGDFAPFETESQNVEEL
jgi:hypothetical protein